MNDEEETVTITQSEYEGLVADRRMLTALEVAGVDNWSGYDYAVEHFESEEW